MIGFPLLSTPTVALLDIHSGMKASSFIGTLVFMGGCFFFYRTCLDQKKEYLAFFLLLVFFNPLVTYQYGSGYPDSWFAGIFLLILAWTHLISEQWATKVQWSILLMPFAIFLAISVRFYGVILIPTIALYMFAQVGFFPANNKIEKWNNLLLAISLAFLMLFVVSAKLGWNPFFNLETVGGGGSIYFNFKYAYLIIPTSIGCVLTTIILNFNVLLIFLFNRKIWNRKNFKLCLIPFVYVIGLLHFFGSIHSMRYYLLIFPFIGWLILEGWNLKKHWKFRKWILGFFLIINCITILNFNFYPLFEIEKTPIRGFFDSLGRNQQIKVRDELNLINETIPENGKLYILDEYYKGAAEGIYEKSSMIRKDIQTIYLQTLEDIPKGETIYLRYRGHYHMINPSTYGKIIIDLWQLDLTNQLEPFYPGVEELSPVFYKIFSKDQHPIGE